MRFLSSIPTDLLIGNIISAVAACFTAASTFAHKRSKIYYLQAWQCGLLAFASIFFHSYAGITTLVLCAIRNVLIGKDIYTKKTCITILILVTGLGLWSNNLGLVGLLPIIATFIYTLWSYYAKEELNIKYNIALNLAIWIVYEIFVLDISTLVADGISLVCCIIAIIALYCKIHKTKKDALNIK